MAHYRTWFFAVCLAVAPFTLASNEAWAVEAIAPSQRPALLTGKVKGAWAKANGALRGVFSEFQAHRGLGRASELFKPSNTSLQHGRGRIVVDAVAVGDAGALLNDLRKMGLQKASRYGAVVSGWIPIGAVSRAVELQSLRSISASFKPIHNVGAVTSEGVVSMNADVVHSTQIGAGITIAVLSDSFNQKAGYADDVASGDLPAGVNILDDTANCGSACSDEGRGMMQLAYDVAP
ncbi:MAG: hypothetical protein O7D27_08940, partial [Alphaproteobacteria bacterium]|nr:hypothetical protein [Alphaproteobacteria bacterium]